MKDGVRYGHIFDPRTGWPVREAQHSVTVAATTCTEAGLLSTLALLQGRSGTRVFGGPGRPLLAVTMNWRAVPFLSRSASRISQAGPELIRRTHRSHWLFPRGIRRAPSLARR
ncbi:MAG: FAD:protein FMN transferase [Gammaproteobacteria bacterium]